MGIRGELFSTKVALQNRTYFFNVKENRLGDLYLNIVESKNRDEGGFERQSVILFADDLQEFLQGFDESLRVLEKAVREKRRGSPDKSSTARRTGEERSDSAPRRSDGFKSRNTERKPRYNSGGGEGSRYDSGKARSERRSGPREKQERKGEGSGAPREGYRDKYAAPRKKRVVVRKEK